jgi:glycosyltransferase involved in cell wall biosynthesis
MKPTAMTSALLISTYNWPEALSLILKSVAGQVVSPDVVLIADDGSDNATKAVIEDFKQRSTLQIRHIWHPDKGFRKSSILNQAIAACAVDYIIQIDGDCLLHPNFVEDHLRAAKQGVFLAGSRINIKDTFRDALFATQRIQYPLGFHGLRNKTRRIYWPFLGRFYRPKNNFSKQFRGCNTSFWRDDFIRINGYNEAFEGWGREDSDLAYRLLHLGCSLQRLKHRGLLYHIPHQTLAKDRLAHNDALEQKTITEKIVRATKGLDQYAVKATGDTSNTI